MDRDLICMISISAILPSAELRYDSVVGVNDLERFNGGHRQ